MVAYDLKGPHECPAVGMKLGGGEVELGEKLPFESGEGKPEFHLREQGGIDEAERPAWDHLVVNAYGSVGRTGKYFHSFVMFLMERLVLLIPSP